MNDRLCLAGVLRVHARTIEPSSPDRFQAADVLAIDLCEGRVVLVEQVSSTLWPAIGRWCSKVIGEGWIKRRVRLARYEKNESGNYTNPADLILHVTPP